MQHLPKIIVTGVSLIIIYVLWQNPSMAGSPGAVSQFHSKNANDCGSCHSSFGGVPQEKCIACHQLDKIGSSSAVRPGKSKPFHAGLQDKNCLTCHTEHPLDGKITLAGFNHNLLGAATIKECSNCHTAPADSKHKKFTYQCSSCHTTAQWSGAQFNHSMLDADIRNNCSGCHTAPANDLHKGVTNCASCHNTTNWNEANVDHDKFFVLDGNHKATCVTCHTQQGNYKQYTCYGCHEHSPERISRKHLKEGIDNFSDCVRCHRSGNEHDIRGGEGGEEHEGGGDDD